MPIAAPAHAPSVRAAALERARAGETVPAIAAALGVPRGTLRRWFTEAGVEPRSATRHPRRAASGSGPARRPPPTHEQLAAAGLARITIVRVGTEDARQAAARVQASLPWANGTTGTLDPREPYQLGGRWVFVYRPTVARSP